jgi:hypothetical protein
LTCLFAPPGGLRFFLVCGAGALRPAFWIRCGRADIGRKISHLD